MSKKLPKIRVSKKKRLGRGYGSGKGGHTVGRGQKGQKARNRMGVVFEGVKMKKSLIKRLPFRRGKDKFKSFLKPLVINLDVLNLLASGTRVSVETLIKNGIVRKNDALKAGVKILGGGEISKKLIIELPISKSAAKAIEKAGGEIVSGNQKQSTKKQENKSNN